MTSPLADKIRPKTLSDVVGQEHLFGKDSLLSVPSRPERSRI